MDEERILMSLSMLNPSQESVEKTFRLFVQCGDNNEQALLNFWMDHLRHADPSDKIAYLYLVNHLLQHKEAMHLNFFEFVNPCIVDAVSLVCIYPSSREAVVKMIQLWQEKEMFNEDTLKELWESTGEEMDENKSPNATKEEIDDKEKHTGRMLPKSLLAAAVNPVVEHLDKLNQHYHMINHVEHKLTKKFHLNELLEFSTFWKSVEDITSTDVQSSRALEELTKQLSTSMDGLRLLKKSYQEYKSLEHVLHIETVNELQNQKEKQADLDNRLEDCDAMDIGLLELQEHKEKYPTHWALHGQLNRLRKKRKHQEASQKAEQIRLRQQKVVAAALADEAAAENKRKAEQAERDAERRQAQAEAKKKQETILEWHPLLKELVPRPSGQVDWESWRDH